MKLTKEQIAEIKGWISKKGFTEIDLQYEILDHMVCAMEELLEKKPSLTLREAFDQVHAGFGIFGFLSVEESMQKNLSRQIWARFKKELKNLFFTDDFILVALVAAILYFTAQVLAQHAAYWFIFLSLLSFFGNGWYLLKSQKMTLKQAWRYKYVKVLNEVGFGLYIPMQILIQFQMRLLALPVSYQLGILGSLAFVFIIYSLACTRVARWAFEHYGAHYLRYGQL
ncbi:hypothetical protein QWY31_02380 [Cytophagales bacterium LB-30]|uniref:Uncharacterized protein n=1 Tax=Shiella aurantiaca TaxID=3058365 RepID=A0ABT8F1Y7_9BACT|nr:hypothetical protein [Shiella aurantiaca]MDN4164328.1 hypothetical protein [Shiella aurantiaca]